MTTAAGDEESRKRAEAAGYTRQRLDAYRAMTPEERASEPIAEMRRALAAEFRRLKAAS